MPPKSKAAAAASTPRRSSRAVAKKSTPKASVKSPTTGSSVQTTPSSATTPESLTSPKSQTPSTVSGDDSIEIPATTTPKTTLITSPKALKSPPKSEIRSFTGDVTESPAISTHSTTVLASPESSAPPQSASATEPKEAASKSNVSSVKITERSPKNGVEVEDKIDGLEGLSEKTLTPSDSATNQAVGTEVLKTANEGAQATPKRTTSKTVVKKTVRIVKKLVKKKVPKRIQKDTAASLNEELLVNTENSNDSENPKPSVLGAMEIEDDKSNDVVKMEVQDHNPETDPLITLEIENPKDHVPMEVEDSNAKPSSASIMENENPSTSVTVSNEVENPNGPEACEREHDGVSRSNDNGNGVSATDIPLEDQKASVTVSKEVENPNEPKACDRDHDGVSRSNDNGNGISATDIPLEDQNVGLIGGENDESETKNVGSGGVEDEEGIEKEVENCEVGRLTKGVQMADGLALSGEMEALERRRRRKTEIFIGGLDKDTKEEDVRKAFVEVGEIVSMRLMLNGKEGRNKGFAFVRFATADDAKKAVAKYSKVEICGKQCGVSLVKGNDTIFLGNIDKKWKNEDVVKLLHGIGIEKLDKVTVVADPSKIDCNRGFAFVEFETTKDAQDTYKKLQKKDVFGKNLKIKVAWAEPLDEPDEEEMLKVKSVYAEYIPSSWDEAKVRDCFKKFGEIESIALARNLRSSRRKDFAFINYTTREAALACIDAFSRESLSDDDSKVNVKVSLAKPLPKVKQIKHTSNPTIEKSKSSQVKLKASQRPHDAGYKGKSSSSNNVDRRSSTNVELVHLLREQASLRQPHMASASGYIDMNNPYSAPGRKRPFSVLGDDSLYSESRQNSRARLETSFLVSSTSGLPQGTGTPSFPYYHQQGANHASSSLYRVEDQRSSYQIRRPSYYGSSGLYHRY